MTYYRIQSWGFKIESVEAERITGHFIYINGRRHLRHSKWKGGCRKYRGHGWNQARQERKKLDGFKCCDCGKHESEFGRSLDVHHIIDFKDGGTNDLSNLVSLCRSCHNKRRAKHGR